MIDVKYMILLLVAYVVYKLFNLSVNQCRGHLAIIKEKAALLREIEYERKLCETSIHNLREYTIYVYNTRMEVGKAFDAIHELPNLNEKISNIKNNFSSLRSLNRTAMHNLNSDFSKYFKMSIKDYESINNKEVRAKNFKIGFSIQ